MTVDREQIRRDAATSRRPKRRVDGWELDLLARHCLALLAELEQAEHDYRMAKHQRDNFERIAREQAENKHALWLWRDEHEARLAKVPALVEAVASALTSLDTGPLKDGYAYAVLSDALERWEPK